MGNSADADQMSPDVSSLLNEVYLYPKLRSNLTCVEIWQAYNFI